MGKASKSTLFINASVRDRSRTAELAETFYGIKQTKCFRAEGLDIIGADVEGIMAKAKSEIEEWLVPNDYSLPIQKMDRVSLNQNIRKV